MKRFGRSYKAAEQNASTHRSIPEKVVYSDEVRFLYRTSNIQIAVFMVRNTKAVIGRINSNESEFNRFIKTYVESVIEA